MPAPDRSGEILAWTRRILDLCGPRPAGSEACLRSAELIAQDLRRSCDRTEVQRFECRPWAFVWHAPATAAAVVVASALLFWGHLYAAATIYALAAGVTVLEFGLYYELVDRLFPRRSCANVVGVIDPQGPAVRQVVVSAHHDSAYEFRYMGWSRHLYSAVAVAYMLAGLVTPLVVAGLALAQLLGAQLPGAPLRILGALAGVGGLVFLGFVRPRAVPGAGDNLVSSGILVHVAAALRARLNAEPGALAGTRVILVSFDAEESGLRGSRAYVRDNRALLEALPTANLNLESFYRLDELCALITDLNGTVQLSARLKDLLVEEGAAEGLVVRPMRMIFGMGACDSAEFARAGFPATTLLAIPHDPLGRGPRVVYHTREDLPENLDPAAIDAAARLTLRMIDRLAREPAASLARAA